jgi:hypothetical protein
MSIHFTMTMVILLGGNKMYVFTFRLWDTTDVVIEECMLRFAMDIAMKRGIYLEDIESIVIREKKYD